VDRGTATAQRFRQFPVRVRHYPDGGVRISIYAGSPDHSERFVMTLPTEQSATLTAVTQEIIDMIRAEASVADLTADSGLQEGGLDSLRIMSLVLRIEARYDIELDADDADELLTVADLARLVVRRIEVQP
jgi:acyl carrier protein